MQRNARQPFASPHETRRINRIVVDAHFVVKVGAAVVIAWKSHRRASSAQVRETAGLRRVVDPAAAWVGSVDVMQSV